MKLRRTLQVAVAVAALVSPLAAFAEPTGSVTTAPVVQQAPALALPVLVALAIALIGVGTYCLRTRSAGAVAGFALVVGLSVLAALSYATIGVLIQGADCDMQTIAVETDYRAVTPSLRADEDHLKQAVVNLMAYAAAYTEDPARMIIRAGSSV